MKRKPVVFLVIDGPNEKVYPLKKIPFGHRIFVTKDGHLEICHKHKNSWVSYAGYAPHEWKYNPKYITTLLNKPAPDGKDG